MNDLQLATTPVAPTGTGLLYSAYDQGSDIAVWKNGAGVTRSLVQLTRVQPKPTPTFSGVERFEFKTYRYFQIPASGVEVVTVLTLSASIPAAVTLADRQISSLQMNLLARDPIWKNAIELGTLPT